MRLMNQEETTGPVNLGNPDERSIEEIAELILKMTGSKSQIVQRPLPQNDPVRRKPDIIAGEEGAGVGAEGEAGGGAAEGD